jgi:hypothetical protein
VTFSCTDSGQMDVTRGQTGYECCANKSHHQGKRKLKVTLSGLQD